MVWTIAWGIVLGAGLLTAICLALAFIARAWNDNPRGVLATLGFIAFLGADLAVVAWLG